MNAACNVTFLATPIDAEVSFEPGHEMSGTLLRPAGRGCWHAAAVLVVQHLAELVVRCVAEL